MAGVQVPYDARHSDDVEGTVVDADPPPGGRPGLEA